MFTGRFRHTIDTKGRLSVPARFRKELAAFDDARLIVVPNDIALEVYPFEEWERQTRKISELSQFNPEVRKLGRLYISRAADVALDGAGRILLTTDSRQQAGLGKDVLLVGIGRLFFEVWDRTRFAEYERSNGDGLPSLFERLSQSGV